MATPPSATDSAMIAELRATVAAEAAARTRIFVMAAEWADAHLDPDAPARPAGECPHGCDTEGLPGEDHGGGCAGGCVGDDDLVEDPFIPVVRWDAPAAFGAAIGRTTRAGSLMIRDALVVRHRLPLLWARVTAGHVPVSKARMIAQAVLGRARDISDVIDREVTPLAHKIGEAQLERKLDDAMLRLHPEQREAEQLEALDRRFVRLDEATLNHVGIADLAIRGDWKDLHDFDRTVSRVADALGHADEIAGLPADSVDVRRSRAIGVLADPAAADALLRGEDAPAPSRQAELVLHLDREALDGVGPVGHNATRGRDELEQAIRTWCGRTDTHLTVLPVIDLVDHDVTDCYRIRSTTRRRVDEIAHTCVFPHCAMPARRCDHDHVVPFDHAQPAAGGASCDCNIAPLCRHHHQLKTHGGWRYTPLDTGLWLWVDPHGQQFLRDHEGTVDVTWDAAGRGCRGPRAPAPAGARRIP